MSSGFRIVIPARYAARRLPGKPLRDICGKPMIEWVYRAACRSGADEVVIATDDARIDERARAFGAHSVMTRADHPSGTDRIVEVIRQLGWDEDTIVVNLQGDEPLMPAANLEQVAHNLAARDCAMATLHKAVDLEEAREPGLVKLTHDRDGYALYFSRSLIPYDRDGGVDAWCGHIGLYAYRASFVERFSRLPPSPLELAEKLEQLRALENGYRIHTEAAREKPGPGIDTEADLARVTPMIEQLLK